MTSYGARSGLPGQEAVRSINGPMSADITALELFAKSIVDSEGWLSDPNIVPIPWREIQLSEKLCFGILVDDGIVKPLPPVTKALERTRRAIEAAGHTVIEYKP
jgi:amidase